MSRITCTNFLAGTCASIAFREADELLVTMALHTSANDLAFEHVESSEQRRYFVSLVFVGHRASAAFLHRHAGLGAVEGLDLRLLMDREHDGMGGRIDIEPDNITTSRSLSMNFGSLESLNCRNPVRLETMRAPDALDGTCMACPPE